LQALLDFARARECLRGTPLRQHAGMDKERAVFLVRERPRAQPVDQLRANSGALRMSSSVSLSWGGRMPAVDREQMQS